MAQVSTAQVHMLPHSLDAERAILAACLGDQDAVMVARSMGLTPRDFYLHAHQLIWDAVLDIAERGRVADVLLVSHWLDGRQNGKGTQLESVGGLAELAKLQASVVTFAGIPGYVDIVKHHAGQRRLIAASADIAAIAQEHEGTLDGLYDEASRRFLETVDTSTPETHLHGGDDAILDYLTEQADTRERLENNPGALIEPPWVDLRNLMGDLLPGSLHVVAAETSVGKTIYMEGVAEGNAKRGHRVAFYHLELPHKFMRDRQVVRYAQPPVTMRQLREGYDGPAVSSAHEAIRPWFPNLTYVYCPGWSAERIVADIQRLHSRGECDLAIVDYLQMIPLPNTRGMNSAMVIGQQANAFKVCCGTLNIPIIVGSQVSRANVHDHRRPTKDDIRNSGEVAERANQVVVLHRPEKRDDKQPTEIIEVYVDKNTSGATGAVRLVHLKGRYLFADEARRQDMEADWWTN
ncbi:MAG: replicative DNA helicase [Anaerovoracaceae bacterium]|jgi:replicative DNA helicase